MNNFTFYSPTEFVFGKDTEKNVGELCQQYGASRIMIVYGGGSVVRVEAASPYSDVVMSLASMGYDKKLVEQKVAQLVEVLTNEADFAGKSQKEREDILFRRAIVELA